MRRKSGLPKAAINLSFKNNQGDKLMTNIGHPEPPHETEVGKDSTPAPEVAKTQEAALKAEEER